MSSTIGGETWWQRHVGAIAIIFLWFGLPLLAYLAFNFGLLPTSEPTVPSAPGGCEIDPHTGSEVCWDAP